MLKILAIGNSFSQDATRYIHEIAAHNGKNIKVVNLYIGGCPLRTHYVNSVDDRKNYSIEFNGVTTGFFASIKEALISDEWDIVTLQQSSNKSFKFETYQPYLDFMADYIKKYSPSSKIYIHQTWPYEQESERLAALGFENSIDMFNGLKDAYIKAKDAIGAEGIIPAGELVVKLYENGLANVYRDTYHLNRGITRYAVALLWYKLFTGADVLNDTFCNLDAEASQEELELARKLAASMELQ